jgi:hypothetical protein
MTTLSVRCPTLAPLLFVALAYRMRVTASSEASAIIRLTKKAPAIPRRLHHFHPAWGMTGAKFAERGTFALQRTL